MNMKMILRMPWALTALVFIFGMTDCSRSQKIATGPLPEKSVYQVSSKWKDLSGKTISLADLRGKFRVLAFVYANCRNVCPLMVESMKTIEEGLRKKYGKRYGDQLGFVLITLDPKKDSPDSLRAFLDKIGTRPDTWTLLQGSEADTLELATLMDIKYRRLEDGEIAHSLTLTLLSPEGEILFQTESLGGKGKNFLDQIKKYF